MAIMSAALSTSLFVCSHLGSNVYLSATVNKTGVVGKNKEIEREALASRLRTYR